MPHAMTIAAHHTAAMPHAASVSRVYVVIDAAVFAPLAIVKSGVMQAIMREIERGLMRRHAKDAAHIDMSAKMLFAATDVYL